MLLVARKYWTSWSEGAAYEKDLSSVLSIMQQAQNLGSIMRFDVPDDSRTFIITRLRELQHKSSRSFHEQAVLSLITPFIQVYEILSLNMKQWQLTHLIWVQRA